MEAMVKDGILECLTHDKDMNTRRVCTLVNGLSENDTGERKRGFSRKTLDGPIGHHTGQLNIRQCIRTLNGPVGIVQASRTL